MRWFTRKYRENDLKGEKESWKSAELLREELALRWLANSYELEKLPPKLSAQFDLSRLRVWGHCFRRCASTQGYVFKKFWYLDMSSSELLFREPYEGKPFQEALASQDCSLPSRLRWGQQAFEAYELLGHMEPHVAPFAHPLLIVEEALLLTPDLEVLLGLYPSRQQSYFTPPQDPNVCLFLHAAISVICLALSHGTWRGERPTFQALVGESLNTFLSECLHLHRGGYDWQKLSCRYLVESERLIQRGALK